MFRWRRNGRPTDNAFLGQLHAKVSDVVGPARIENGVLTGDAGWSVAMLPNHAENPNHFDVGFSLPGERGIVPDCMHGFGRPRQAAREVLHIWRETSGACFLELLTGGGDFATHLTGEQSRGIAGWHTVASGIIGYGHDTESSHRLQNAMLENDVMLRLSDHIVPRLDPGRPNGVKFFFCVGADRSITAEVRINGEADEDSSHALAHLPWPALDHFTIARCFAVALHPQDHYS